MKRFTDELSPDALAPAATGQGTRFWSRTDWLLKTSAIAVIVYSVLILIFVATSGDLGIRCVLGTRMKEEVPAHIRWREEPPEDRGRRVESRGFTWSPGPPRIDSTILAIDGRAIDHYPDYVRALYVIHRKIGAPVAIRWEEPGGRLREGVATVASRPLKVYFWSLMWFVQELGIFAIGTLVFLKRPHDVSARRFFWLCVVTVGAFMGGYHWSEIVIYPPLIYAFALCAVFLPVVSLHFYLTFPRPRPAFLARRRPILRVLYGVPAAYLAALWLSMAWSRYVRDGRNEVVSGALDVVKALALGYVAVAALIFAVSLAYLLHTFWTARSRAERDQVRWVLLASLVSSLLIAHVIAGAIRDPGVLGRDQTAWTMYAVSLLYTLAYAISITRYKLMHAEEIVNRGVVYVGVSVAAGLLYSAALVVGALLVGMNLDNSRASREAKVVAVTALVILTLAEVARRRFQKALDRRFYREKYKFDQAMGKMRLAVGSLVDRPTLGRRLLEAAAEVLHLEWGAIYLAGGPGRPPTLVACHGPEPDERSLAAGNPLLARLREVPTIRVPHAMALANASDPATDAMIALGGEVAAALEVDGAPAGLLVLGPKRNGMPYEDDEIAFLGALASVATMALHSADIQQTLEGLNQELRDKVDKIAEQQRRILVLQDQLMQRSGSDDPAPAPDAAPPVDPVAFVPIKGSGPAVRQMLEVARKVAASPSAVLIRGESGTGKELLAEAIHAASPRAGRSFVKVHCAALSQNLLESELFGHVRGAFTGADRDRVGRFQEADGGTLFLDEIGDISLEVQTKLLRVLQARSFERVGSSQSLAVDVRILAATHQDLEALIRAGRFRADLYYRLNVISLRTPSLRERREDIFELAVHFLGHHARRVGKPVTRLEDDAIEALIAYDWPGNIRELENVIERAVVLAEGPAVTLADLPAEVLRPAPARRPARPAAVARSRPVPVAVADPPRPPAAFEPKGGNGLDSEFEAYERSRLIDALEGAGGNISEAARLLRMPRSTFFSKLKKHGLARGRIDPAKVGDPG